MDIYEASSDEGEAIRRVAERSWEHDYPGILSRETAEEGVGEWYGAQRLDAALADPKNHVLVAEREGTAVGFAHALVDGTDGVVFRLYVHPDHRQEGVGRDLFETVAETLFAYDIDRIRAMVLAENTPGNDFYRRLGFQQVESDQTTIAGEAFSEHTYELPREAWGE